VHSTAAIAGARLDAAALQDWCTALPQLPQLPAARYPAAAGPLIMTRAERGVDGSEKEFIKNTTAFTHVTRTTRGFLEGVDTELAPIELGSREALWPLVFSPSELPTERLFDEADACPFRC